MSRQDKTTEATLRLLQGSAPNPAEPARGPEMVLMRKTVANSSARTMVYLPTAWKEKFREIAYHERRKENDLCLEAFRDFLAKKGHFMEGG